MSRQPENNTSSPPLLRIRELTKRYAVTVLDHVTLDFHGGEIHALIGANGAGKSTLCRIIAGLVAPTSGSLLLDRRHYAPASKAQAEHAGVQIVQQELNLIPTLSVAENVMLNRLPNRWGWIRRAGLLAEASSALDRMGLRDVSPDAQVGSLGIGHQQLIEIATALHHGGRVLILDEPTAALSTAEVERLFGQLQELRAAGVAIIYVSHRLDEIKRIADRVSILRDGHLISSERAKTQSTDQMVNLMTGDRQSAPRDYVSCRTAEVALRVDGLTRLPAFENVSFSVHRGERLGIAGLVGSGRSELLRAIFGADKADSGAIYLQNASSERVTEPLRFSQPRQATRRGLAMVTEDRKENGLLLTQSIRVNTTICGLRCFARGGVIRLARERDAAGRLHEKLDTQYHDLEQPVQELSGGNQQKVAIAKWLQISANVFLFDEPTRGIDIAARRLIYQLFEHLASEGRAQVLVSSDLDELLLTCDRIIVMSGGRRVASFERANWTRAAILRASFSGYLSSSVATEVEDGA